MRSRNTRTGMTGEMNAWGVSGGDWSVWGGVAATIVATNEGVSDTVSSVVVVAVGTGCVNCDRENTYTADSSTAAITDPSPLMATECALIAFLAVKEPSFVPARS